MIVISTIITSIIVPIISSVRVSSGYNVSIIVSAVFPLLAAASSMTRIMSRLIIIFIIATRTWFPNVIFSISPSIGNLHQFGDRFWLLPAKFFDI
jgi:hypothetical protein